MNTVVVAIVGTQWTDNFKHLPLVFHEIIRGEETRFVVHNDPQSEYRTHRLESNYDLLLDLNYETQFHKADFVSKRLNKMDQGVVLADIAELVEPAYFHQIPTLNKRPSPRNMFDMTNIPELVLIKSVDGARGVGHVIFDTTKASVFCFMAALDRFSNGKAPGDEAPSFDSVMEEFKHAIEIHAGQMHCPEEIQTTLCTQQLMIQPIVDGVTLEIRVVLDSTRSPRLIKVRTRNETVLTEYSKGSGYKQATGANRDSDTVYDTLEEAVPSSNHYMLDEVEEFIKHLPPINSVDLFFTKTGWGIFEYCNQFGTEAFDISDTVNLHTGLIAQLWEQKLERSIKG